MKKYISLIIVFALLAAVLAGCGAETAAPASDQAASVSESAPAPEPEQAEAPAEDAAPPAEAEASEGVPEGAESEPVEEAASITYPMVTDGSQAVTVWVSLPPHVAPYMEDVSESAAYQVAMEATGIQMITTTISTAVEMEQFQLMCASGTTGDYDFLVGAVRAYGSADAAVADEILMDLSDYIPDYMPDFNAFLQNDEEIRKVLTTDTGAIVNIAGRATGGRPQGFGIRKDWLDKAGLDIPVTYDELHDVLTVFKNDYDCEQPLLMFSTGFLDNDFLCAGLGMTQSGYYVDNGTVKFAYLEDSFREYATMIKEWYSEGLLSKDFLNNVQGMGISYDAQMQDGSAGVFMTGVDIFSNSSKEGASDPDWEAVPMADMTRTGKETITLGRTPNADPLSNAWNVTTGVEEDRMEYVLGFANWFFTEDGSIACNFGIEGESFEYDSDGNPRLTELVTNNPEGMGSFIAEAKYLNWCAPYCLDERYYDSIYDTQAQADANEIWNSNRDTTQKYYGEMTADENAAYSDKYSDIDTYISNMSISFMTGAADIDAEWDDFVSQIQSMGIDDCIQIKQQAYDRYLQR